MSDTTWTCPNQPFGHQWAAGLQCRLCGATRTAGEAIVSGLASARGWSEDAAAAVRDAHKAEALHEAADFVGNDDDCGCGGCDSCIPRALAAGLLDMADAEEKATAPAATATPQGPVFDPLPPYLHAIGQAGSETERALYAAYVQAITEVTRLQAETGDGQPSAGEAAAGLTVYRTSHDSIVMGLYTTAAAAREHCEAEERRSWAKFEGPTFDWIEDEEDGVAELTAWVGGEECTTGYEVTALEVASAYDEEADE